MDETKGPEGLGLGQIQEVARGFQASRILLTAAELGVFDALGTGQLTAAEVSAACGTDPRATDRLLCALCAIGLLHKHGGLYANTQGARECLVRSSPGFAPGILHALNLWQSWSHLTEAVRLGNSPVPLPINDRGEQWLTAFIHAMHAVARQQADALTGLIDLAGVTRLLDIGAGSGAHVMAFVRASDALRATAYDLPNVIPLTRSFVEKEGLADRVEFACGDFNTDDLGAGFDLVFVSSIIHIYPPERNVGLLAKIHSALNAGGQVVIQDFIMDEDRVHPPGGAVFALNMLVAAEHGDTYTESEVRGWLESVGFRGVQRKDTPHGTTLMAARKE